MQSISAIPAARAADTPRAPAAGGARRLLRERVAALLDAFAWPLRASDYLALFRPLRSTRELLARVEQVIEETAEARTLVLRPARAWPRHVAGQFVTLGVTIEGARHDRTYSISSAPERPDGRITITVQAVEGGRVSHHLVHGIRAGETVALGAPQGEFVLPEATPHGLLFVTAGSGITPVMSMLRSLASRGPLPDVVHLHYVREASRLIFARELERLAREHPRYRLHVVETRAPGSAVSAPRTRFTAAELARLCSDWTARDAYACGPEGLLDAAFAEWAAAGVASRLRVERFHARRVAPEADAQGGVVRFARSACTVRADGATPLLRVAEDAGLAPAHGCRIGVCHSCTVRLVAGAVRDVRDGRVTVEPGAPIQLCVSAPRGDVEVEA